MDVNAVGSNPVVVKPKDITIDRQYVFAVKAIAEGGATITTEIMTLNMGCGFWNIITEPADFNYTQIHDVFVNEIDSLLYHFTWSNFTIFPDYCDLKGYLPVNVMHNGVAKDDRIIFPPKFQCLERAEGC